MAPKAPKLAVVPAPEVPALKAAVLAPNPKPPPVPPNPKPPYMQYIYIHGTHTYTHKIHMYIHILYT